MGQPNILVILAVGNPGRPRCAVHEVQQMAGTNITGKECTCPAPALLLFFFKKS